MGESRLGSGLCTSGDGADPGANAWTSQTKILPPQLGLRGIACFDGQRMSFVGDNAQLWISKVVDIDRLNTARSHRAESLPPQVVGDVFDDVSRYGHQLRHRR